MALAKWCYINALNNNNNNNKIRPCGPIYPAGYFPASLLIHVKRIHFRSISLDLPPIASESDVYRFVDETSNSRYYIKQVSVQLATYVRWQRGTAPIHSLRAAAAAVDRYLLPAGPTASKLQQQVCHAGTDRRMGTVPYRFIDPAPPHTVRVVPACRLCNKTTDICPVVLRIVGMFAAHWDLRVEDCHTEQVSNGLETRPRRCCMEMCRVPPYGQTENSMTAKYIYKPY